MLSALYEENISFSVKGREGINGFCGLIRTDYEFYIVLSAGRPLDSPIWRRKIKKARPAISRLQISAVTNVDKPGGLLESMEFAFIYLNGLKHFPVIVYIGILAECSSRVGNVLENHIYMNSHAKPSSSGSSGLNQCILHSQLNSF